MTDRFRFNMIDKSQYSVAELLLLVVIQAALYACNAHPAIPTAHRCFMLHETFFSQCHVAVSMLHGKKQAVVGMVQGGKAAMYTLDHNGDERQLSLLVGQWPHHGVVAGTPHLSLFHAAGTAAPTLHALLLSSCKSHLHLCTRDISAGGMYASDKVLLLNAIHFLH